MKGAVDLEIRTQPNEFTCGPTCLHAVYGYFGERLPLEQVVSEVPMLDEGGTLGCILGSHALSRGWQATLYTWNLTVFDPVWFRPGALPLPQRLAAQLEFKKDRKLATATRCYLDFLARGGRIEFEDMHRDLIRNPLRQGLPVLTGLSATYLHRSFREVWVGDRHIDDDLRGEPQGHFVVLCGYRAETREVLVADPLHPNPVSKDRKYPVPIDRVMSAIMLGVLTYDANILIIRPPAGKEAHARRRQ